MAIYEETKENVLQNIKMLDISSSIKEIITKIITETAEKPKLYEFKGQPVEVTKADVVSIPKGIQITSDPGGRIVIFNADAAPISGNIKFDAKEVPRIVVGTGKSDVINFEGTQPVTVETGGGNDTVTTAQGNDVVFITGSGKASIDTGAGFDRVEVKGGRGGFSFKIEGKKVIMTPKTTQKVTLSGEVIPDGEIVQLTSSSQTPNIEANIQGAEVIKFEDGKISVVADTAIKGLVARLYEVLFNREADLPGLEYWFNVAEKADIKDIIHGFLNSVEYKILYANLSDEQFLRMLYKGMADREPDREGFNYWLSKLKEGVSKVDIVYGFVASEEAIKVLGLDGSTYVIDFWKTG